jgi:hypothetical protein
MAKQEDTSTQRYETVDPKNPPNSVLKPEVRTAALWAYLGPLLVVTVVVLIALLYWSNRADEPNDNVAPTTGISDEGTPGGGTPAPRPDSTNEELNERGR